MNKHRRFNNGFTIVELLVVIVVIGVLAAITVVSYTGISQKAVVSSLQSDLANASKQLKMFQVENSNYPSTIDCGQADSSTNKCLKTSSGNSYGSSYTYNNSSNPQSFSLSATNTNGTCYSITNSTAPALCSVALFFDDFNRADGAIGGSYNTSGSLATITGNNVLVPATTGDITPNSLSATLADAKISVKMVTSDYLTLFARSQAFGGAVDRRYQFNVNPTGWTLYKYNSGSTLLASGSWTLASGDIVALRCVGTSLIATRNGVEIANVTDSLRVNGYWGVRWGNGVTTQFDDLKVEAAS